MKQQYLLLCLLLIVTGCVTRTAPIIKIALLAPFEGLYRDIGYQALYAARLALAESATQNVHLLAIDDGGSIATARDRAQAIQRDPAIALTLALGSFATAPDVQNEFTNTPLLIVGNWQTSPATDTAYHLTSPAITPRLTLPDTVELIDPLRQSDTETDTPLIGDELLALESLALLLNTTDNTAMSDIRVLSAGQLPDADFRTRYQAADSFAPEPGLLAPLTYDATRLALQSISGNTPLNTIRYEGYHGVITFDSDGFWQNAPVYEYVYQGDTLVPAP